jgi:hypothetical protein
MFDPDYCCSCLIAHENNDFCPACIKARKKKGWKKKVSDREDYFCGHYGLHYGEDYDSAKRIALAKKEEINCRRLVKILGVNYIAPTTKRRRS